MELHFWKKAADNKGAEAEEKLRESEDEFNAIQQNTAYISFNPQGYIIDVNDIFLAAVGYSKAEVLGKHHRIFCDASYSQSSSYDQFWRDLANGIAFSGTFERFKKNGESIFLAANYFPVRNHNNIVVKIIKIANDVTKTQQVLDSKNAVLEALDKSLAVIEFTPDGDIVNANANFLSTMGYELSAIVGKHHRLFCDNDFYKENPDFWRKLARGEHFSGRFKRKDARGEIVWLEATYNPIFNQAGKVYKVIKFASDITERVSTALKTVDMAATTSEETSQITTNAVRVLNEAVETSHSIADQVKAASIIGAQLISQSKSINDIVTTIRAIADQTNLLALNAAIEAARAGDAGRGFSVVADAVSKLAADTAKATAEIANVVKNNTALIHQVDEKLDAITGIALHGEDSINEVASGLDDVRNGVNQFLQMVEMMRP